MSPNEPKKFLTLKIYMRKTTIIFFIISLVFCISCRSSEMPKGKIVVAIQAGPITLDPRIATDAEGDKISALICDGLFERDENQNLVPKLASSYERISDTSYRFFLRPGVLFHDGASLTADDVSYTYKSIIDGKVVSAYKNAFERVKEIIVEDPLTIRVDLKEPYAPFLTMLTRGIVSRTAAEAKRDKFGREPVCAGPYKLVKLVSDSVVELKANLQYFGDAPANSGIIFEVIKDDNIRVMKLLKGDVDLVQNAISPMLMDSVLKNPGIEMKDNTSTVMTYMGMNLADPILSKNAVRQAIALAIDRDEIISHRWKGMAVKANSVLAPGNFAYDDELSQYPYDPQKAKKLLDEAGFKDPDADGPKHRFNLLYKTSTLKDRVDIARMIAHQLEKVGIGVRVEPYEWGTFYRDVKNGNFQIYTLSWVGVTDPDIFYDICDSSQFPPIGMNRGRYKNAEVDRLVEAGRVEMDEGKRREIYFKVQRILLSELPFIPLWYEKNVDFFRKGISDVEPRPDASYRMLIKVKK